MGNAMVKANQLAIEVRYVALPANELADRRARLRMLLVRGALRFVQEGLPNNPEKTEVARAEFVQK